MKYSFVYILTNRARTVFYTGFTSDLSRRMEEHRSGKGSAFCRKYHVRELVFYELHIEMIGAIRREKQIKRWNKEWKLNLIRKNNPQIKDLLDRS
jgi:putative endonuclease